MKDWRERVNRAVSMARTILQQEGSFACPTAFIYGDDWKILSNDEEKDAATALFRQEATGLNATLFFFIEEISATDVLTGRHVRAVRVYVQSADDGEWCGLAFIRQKKSFLAFFTRKKGYPTFGELELVPMAGRHVDGLTNRFCGLLPSEMKKILAEVERKVEEHFDQTTTEQMAEGLYQVLCRQGPEKVLDAGMFSAWATKELQRELDRGFPIHKKMVKLLRTGLSEELIEKGANIIAEKLRAAVLEIARRHGPR